MTEIQVRVSEGSSYREATVLKLIRTTMEIIMVLIIEMGKIRMVKAITIYGFT